MELSPEDRLILSCVKLHPTPEELERVNMLIPLIKDWDYLISTIIDRGIGPLLFKKLPLITNRIQIPESVKTDLQQVYYKTFSRSTILYEHFRKITEVFTFQEIPLIALKGIYLSEGLYQDIGLRQFSDIDLLVKKEDGLKCLSILAGLGYKPSTTSKIDSYVEEQFDIVHYSPLVLNGVSVEIHIRLHNENEKYDLNVDEVWKNVLNATINGVSIFVLDTYDQLIHLCLHLHKHFREGKIQFTCFNDITNFLEKYSETLDWSELRKRTQHYICEDIVFEYIVLVHNYMNASVPADIIQRYAALLTNKDDQLFYSYLKGNNFITINSVKRLSGHFSYLKKNQTFFYKVRYLYGVLFPSKAFMIYKYKIKNPVLVMFYYPYRYYIGIMGVMNYLKKKVFGRK